DFPSDWNAYRVRKVLDKAGVEFRTMSERSDGGHSAVISGAADHVGPQVQKIADRYNNVKVSETRGDAKLVGSWDSRAEGTRAYNEVLAKHGEDVLRGNE